jgi:malate dehydrogenase (oxaloacetate-decarboxylating)(NADP+)
VLGGGDCVIVFVLSNVSLTLTFSLCSVNFLRAGNNAYIFPGIGLGVLAAGLTRITNHDMLIAARSLASQVTDKELEVGCVYPPLTIIRDVAARIAAAIAENAHDSGKATKSRPTDMLTYVKSLMYDPFDDPFQAH